jgi:murein tripeptide amidase MpaA
LARFEAASLKNDLLLGWKPKTGIKNPFPIIFPEPMCCKLREEVNFVYKGYKPINSFDLHARFSGASGYTVADEQFKLFKVGDLDQLNSKDAIPVQTRPNELEFDSFFECGNLDFARVNQLDSHTYDLFLRPDSSSLGHTQWFYFSVKAKLGKNTTFLIRNMSKKDSIFSKTGTPYYSLDNVHWSSLPSSSYYLSTFTCNEDTRPANYRNIYTLRFEWRFLPEQKVYFAYCPPFTFSRTQRIVQDYLANKYFKTFLSKEALCMSCTGLEVSIINCTDKVSRAPILQPSDRPAIFITARVHPGETCASFMMQGLMEKLFGTSEQSQILRELFDFYLVPVLNPDGVVVGNFRTNIIGDDLNRRYLKPSGKFHPSVFSLIKKVEAIKLRKKVCMFLDLHGHSTRTNVFTYGPEISTLDPLFNFTRLFPKLIGDRTDMFKFNKCSFRISKPKLSTARAVFLLKKGKPSFLTKTSNSVILSRQVWEATRHHLVSSIPFLRRHTREWVLQSLMAFLIS